MAASGRAMRRRLPTRTAATRARTTAGDSPRERAVPEASNSLDERAFKKQGRVYWYIERPVLAGLGLRLVAVGVG